MIEINLLPKELQIQGPRLSFSRAMIMPVAGAVVLVAAMVGLTIFQKSQIKELDNKISIAQARAEQLKKDIEMVDALVDIKEKITARIEAVKLLDQNRNSWVNILEDLSSQVPDFLWLTAFKEVQPTPVAAAAAQNAQAANGGQDTTTAAQPANPQIMPAELEGYAYSLNSLATFIINMKKSGYFDTIDLSHAREVPLESHAAYSFKLTCSINYGGSIENGDSPEVGTQGELAQTQ